MSGGNGFHGSHLGAVASNSSIYAGWDIDGLLASIDDDLVAAGAPPTSPDHNRSANAPVTLLMNNAAALSSDSIFDLDRLIEELSCENKPSYKCVVGLFMVIHFDWDDRPPLDLTVSNYCGKEGGVAAYSDGQGCGSHTHMGRCDKIIYDIAAARLYWCRI